MYTPMHVYTQAGVFIGTAKPQDTKHYPPSLSSLGVLWAVHPSVSGCMIVRTCIYICIALYFDSAVVLALCIG